MSVLDFVTEVKALVKEQINNMHTALPGEIVSIDKNAGLVSVKPKAQMQFSNGKTLEFPIISGVPIVMPQSAISQSAIVFPVNVGDQCLLIFSEQALDYWFETGMTAPQVKYGLSGAIAIPGLLRTQTDVFKEALERDAVIIKHKNASITLSNAGIAIRGDISVEGNLLINGEIKSVPDEI